MDSSNATKLAQGLAATMGGPATALSSAMTTASQIVATHGSSSWMGLFGRLILALLQLTSTLLYFIIKLTTFSLPTLLFTLFSTSLTVTMNATTL